MIFRYDPVMAAADSHGFTLIEVLIAWAILSSILFSIIALETVNSRHLYHTYLRDVAVVQLENMLERLRANRDAAFRERELNLWDKKNQQLLPHAKGNYNCVSRICTVTIHWQELVVKQLSLSALM